MALNTMVKVWQTGVAGIMICLAALSQAAQLNWLADTRLFAYVPSAFHFKNDRPVLATRESIRQDLQLMRHYSDGLILYATDQSTADILAAADRLKYRVVILGVWTITDQEEINLAVALARRYPDLVQAIVVGNEGLFWQRYDLSDLTRAFDAIRASLPAVALTTTEPFVSHLGSPARLDCANQDFLLPTIHPVFEHWFEPSRINQSVQFIDNIVTRLLDLCHKPILIKETGIPSGPSSQSYSEDLQRQFWQALLTRMQSRPEVGVALFEAFDGPWKVAELKKQSGLHDEREHHWGWFTHQRRPKAVVEIFKTFRQ